AATGERRLLVVRATWLQRGEEPPGILAIARDLTAERDAEQQLRLLHEALSVTSKGLALFDRDWRTIYANRSYGNMLIDVPEQAQREMREVLERSGRWSGRLVRPEAGEGDTGRLRVVAAAVEDPDGDRSYFVLC